MKCNECRHWQGTKYSTFGDCFRVVMALSPELETCFLDGVNFSVPFDPHDVKYWVHNELWKKMYVHLCKCATPRKGVRAVQETRDDIVYDQKNGERVGRLKLTYFQTHRDYECKGEE